MKSLYLWIIIFLSTPLGTVMGNVFDPTVPVWMNCGQFSGHNCELRKNAFKQYYGTSSPSMSLYYNTLYLNNVLRKQNHNQLLGPVFQYSLDRAPTSLDGAMRPQSYDPYLNGNYRAPAIVPIVPTGSIRY